MRSSRLIALSTVAAFSLTVVTGSAATPQQTLPIRVVATAAKPVSVKTATLIAEVTVQTWQCQDKLVLLGVRDSREQMQSAWSLPKSDKYRKWVLHKRIQKQSDCLRRLHRFAYEWNWQAFPKWVINLARCESSVNWYAEGSSNDGVFYSAFNISRSRYDEVAHKMGVRGWNEGRVVPSPYEQAMAVIGYVRTYGDGFTGRCHGIARSSWN